MKYTLFLVFILLTTYGYGQDITSNYRVKKVIAQDTVYLDSVSINPARFQIKNKSGAPVSPFSYRVNYEKAYIVFSEKLIGSKDTVSIEYLKYPAFITRPYYTFDPKVIVDGTESVDKLYKLEQITKGTSFQPFDGLNTAGNISRGVTIGNNQNAVVNSELDLQITGKLSDKVSIRASIQDANIPTQQGGYSQSLNEFDQIFIELYSDNWNIRAGDVDLTNQESYFSAFTKKVQGISLGGTVVHENGAQTKAFAAGALVRGIFNTSQFTGQEGNQGPYKLIGPNGELYILVVSGSEVVYVNGLALARGENKDYVIDYNSGEIKFNPTYPITSNMRITVDYQFTDRNYTRFIGYGGGSYSNDTFEIGTYVYSESDAKNQPLQQNLSEEQVSILQQAGDDRALMVAPSAVADTFSENKILYKKVNLSGIDIFVFSSNPEDALFNVRFSLVGQNIGNYVLSNSSAISRIFQYVPPVNGQPQGNYEPIIQLTAPTKIQIGGLHGTYHPSEKTKVGFEVAGSKNDLNLFSTEDDGNNSGFAGRIEFEQSLLSTTDTLKISGLGSLDIVNRNFVNVERIYNQEFNRDWNLLNPTGNQQFITAGIAASHPRYGTAQYEFQQLSFSENFTGSRHVLRAALRANKIRSTTSGSLLSSESDTVQSNFFRIHNATTYSLNNAWIGAKISQEDNQIKNGDMETLSPLSQKYQAYEAFVGVGDSTKVYVEGGYQYRLNDSVRNNTISRVNSRNSYYLKSKLLNSTASQLSIFVNYQVLKDELGDALDDQSLNSRILYNQRLFDGGIQLNTTLESNNGVIAQQEFTYLKVEPGQGVYTWKDYNNNGVQELDEFEIAQYQDEAEYVRILLPNQVFLKIRENAFSQILTLNPQAWVNKEGLFKTLSHFYNQTSFQLNRKVRRNNDDLLLNPFEDRGDDQLGLTQNFRNALFYNRGKQHYTTSYTFLASSTSNLISLGLQTSKLQSHQLNFNHKVWESWLITFKGIMGDTESISENFEARNFLLDSYELNPKLSYLVNQKTRFDVFYTFLNKKNTLGEMELLDQQKIGVSFSHSNAEKISLSGSFNYITNDFAGSAFSPVAYQMLEGLQPGTNFTWNLLLQKKITKYLDANLSYFGRKSENSSTIHTGNLQLRAFF